MIITAKFASVCPCCSARIAVGEKVEWERGSKARHAACAGKPAAPTTARRSAYSRGYGTSRQYGWDGVVGSPSYYSSGQYDEDS